MCGIIGAINFNDTPLPYTEEDFNERMDRMAYRGPDARDQWVHDEQPVRFGHLRLSIVGLGPEGTQPMHMETPGGTLSITFNGEVYNYLEIKDSLKELGYVFETDTDTEVVLTAFAAWGADCVNRFTGMFAMGIYNDADRSVFLARDRLGKKPLYVHLSEDGNELRFASEIKAIKDMVEEGHMLDHSMLHEYMQYGYIPGQKTMQRNIMRLPPGHCFYVKPGESRLHQYWSLNFPSASESQNANKPLEEYIKEGREILDDSLRLRMRSDVPVGVFLSGGLDSSAVVALLAEQSSEKIKTFSVRYDIGEYGEEYDESKFAEQVAEQFDTEHHTYTMTAEDFEKYIPSFVRTMDEPVTEAAALSLHFVSELAKNHVTVVLSGEGSDELFAGYDLYQRMQTLETIHNTLGSIGTKIAAGVIKGLFPAGNKIRKYAELAALPFEQRYRGISVYEQGHRKGLYSPTLERLIERDRGPSFAASLMAKTRHCDLLNRMLHFDTHTWLVDDLLTKADRMSMGSSLELRVPFLDHRLVEFAANIPSEYKISGGEGKFILKRMMEGLLPDNIIYREKRGFPTPLARMFQGPLKGYVERLFFAPDGDTLCSAYFDMKYIRKLCDEHWSGKTDHHRILWQLVVLEEWLRQHPQLM